MSTSSFSTEEKDFFNELIRDRRENARVIQKRSMRGVERDVVDKYPDSAHFIYELLQNADDAKATKIFIRLESDGLLFKHNGDVHFTITDPRKEEEDAVIGHINSITSVGASTKEQNDNTIGKFGVGFKAVFQYTKTPHIYDTKFRFLIKNLFVPELLENDHIWRDANETLFWFPFNREDKQVDEAYGEILQKLEELDNPILFLRSLQEIEWYSSDKSGVYKKEIKHNEIINDIECQLINVNNNSRQYTLWMFTQYLEIKNTVLPISTGLYVDEKTNKISSLGDGQMYCFFPIKETIKGLGCILHAPFELVSSRQNIKVDNNTNTQLLNKLAELFADSLLCLRDISEKFKVFYLDNDIFRLIPKVNYYWEEGRLIKFNEALLYILSNERLLLSNNKEYVYARNVYLTSPINLKDLFDTQRLNLLLKSEGNYFLESDYSAKDADILDLLQKVGVRTLSTENFADAISESFMKAQTIEWLHKFYQFISEDAKNLWNIDPRYKNRSYKLRHKPIILLENGEYVSPDTNTGDINVFYKSEVNNFTANIINPLLLEVKSTEDFLIELGVKEPDMYDYITTKVLPLYAGNNIDIDDDEIRKHIKMLFEYSQNCPSSKRRSYIEKISSTISLVAKDNITGETYFATPSIIYEDNEQLKHFFSIIEAEKEKQQIDEWKAEYGYDWEGEEREMQCLKSCDGKYLFRWKYYNEYTNEYIENEEEEIYKPENSYLFLDSTFYGDLFSDHRVLEFVIELGVMRYPELTKLERRITSSRDWITKYRDLSSITPPSQDLSGYVDYNLEELECYLDVNLTFENSKLLWDIISAISSIYYRAQFRFHPYGGQYIYDPQKEYHSNFIDTLQNTEWLYTSDKRLVKPIDISIDELDNSYERKSTLIDALCFKTKKESIELPPEIQADVDLARRIKDKGYSEDDFAELDKLKQQREAKEQRKREKTDPLFEPKDRTTPKSTEELFSEAVEKPKSKPKQDQDITNKNIESLIKKQEEEVAEQSRINNIRSEVKKLDKYSYKWFKSLLELEYMSSGEESYGSRSITINFNSVERELNSERIYILKNPSRYIPTSLEEIGGLYVKFIFSNRDEISIGFEVANVKDYSLRLKAKLADSELLSQIDFSRCNRAIVDIGNPVQLLDKLRRAYESLSFDDRYNLRDNLQDNISFVFGPPGTGKTTYLSKEIIRLLESNDKCRVLVLTPTNKACDVIAKKIIEVGEGEIPAWLSRFAATGDESLEMIVQGGDSKIYNEKKSCIISTIARYPYDMFSSSSRTILLKDIDWDYIIVDEASMIPLSYISYVIYTQMNKNVIIAGDPFQIAPIVREEMWKGENIYKMVDLKTFDTPTTQPIQFKIKNLDTQYRSVPSIGTLFSHYSYSGKLKHARSEDSKKELEIDGVDIKSINYLPFKVERYDSIFGVKKLSSSNIHIYSVLFVFEFVKYVEAQISAKYNEIYRIGIICPYAAQAQLIEKLFEQHIKADNIEITVGTIHGFQGDECDIVFAVFNPPMGLRREPEKTFINNKNIVNVAISRARDYLFIVMPDNEMENFSRLYELNNLGKITKDFGIESCTQHCFDIEDSIFDYEEHIEAKTFVTTHQMANVYSEPDKVYEVRVDDSAIDIQINLE